MAVGDCERRVCQPVGRGALTSQNLAARRSARMLPGKRGRDVHQGRPISDFGLRAWFYIGVGRGDLLIATATQKKTWDPSDVTAMCP